ncbi:uncharacterized protein TNCV_1792641 [Trichonephila clavipes]|nr:uncharacterized protein TNCV_1792641 [Trichonephila clavipes]
MAQDEIFQYLMDQMFPYFYEKYGKVPSDVGCSGSFVANKVLTEDLFEIIAKTFYVLGCVLLLSWSNFLDEHYALMARSPKHYISLAIKACYIENHFNCDIHERFISVGSLVTVIGKYIYIRTNQAFYKLTPLILTVFFENVMKEDFEKQGSWKNLEKYLSKERFSDWYDSFKSSRYFIDHFDSFPEEIKIKLKELTLRRGSILASYEIVKTIGSESEIKDLTQKVISSAETSILYELRWPGLDEKQWISKKDEVSASNSSPCSSTVSMIESKLNPTSGKHIKDYRTHKKKSNVSFEHKPTSDSCAKDNRTCIRKSNNTSFSTNHFNTKISLIEHNSKAEVINVNLSVDSILKESNFHLKHLERTIKSLISLLGSLDVT